MPSRENAEKVKSVKSGKNNFGRKPVVDEDILKSHLEQGKKDAEIALAMGVSRRTIAAARQRMGLESNHGINDEQLIALHSEGKTDNQIAETLGVPRTTIVMARKRLNLEANYGLNKNELTDMHKEGKTDKEIAENLCVPRTTVVMARKRLGLEANKKKGRSAKKPSMLITKRIKDNVMRQLAMGYAPREVAIKNGLSRKEVINIYMSCKPKTWSNMLDALNENQQNIFYVWRYRAESIIKEKVMILEVEVVKAKIKEIRQDIAELPPEEKGGLPTPKVMARMGVRNAYMVDMWQDAQYVGMRHMIELLKWAMERKYWKEIRSGMDLMDKEVLRVAERYLHEEVYIPFFASEFNGIMLGPIKETKKYKDKPGICLDYIDDYKPDKETAELLNEDQEKSIAATSLHRGKGGGKRKSLEYVQSM